MNREIRRIIAIIIVFFIVFGDGRIVFSEELNLSSETNSKQNRINFQNITIKNGLSSDVITQIFQDSYGYMWIGTEDGLNQYDGNRVKVYNFESKNKNSLSSTYVTSICEDSDGNIWVGTNGGLNIVDSKTESVIRLEDSIIGENNLSNSYVTVIYKDSNDTMWVGTTSGLNRYDKENNKFVEYYYHDDEEIRSNYITDISEDKNGCLWVATRKGSTGVDLNNLSEYLKNDVEFNNHEIYAIDRDINDDMWIINKKGVFKNNVVNDETNMYEVDIDTSDKNSIRAILCDSNGSVWFGTADGLVEYNEQSNSTNVYKKDGAYPDSIASNSITCLYEDEDGVLWIGTNNGISILNTEQQFSNRINNILKKINIPHSSIIDIIEDSNNDIWIGTESNGVIGFIVETEERVTYSHDDNDNKTLSSNKINNIYEAREGVFIISTDKGVDVLYKETGEVIRNVGKELEDNYVNYIISIYNDGDSYWIGTKDNFFRKDIITDELISYKDIFNAKGIENYEVADIFQDENDEDILWLAGERNVGLIKLSKTKGIIKNYTAGDGVRSLSYDCINCIISDGNGNLWIGTDSGLNKFNISDETFISYSEKDGLVSDYINSIVIDDYGDLWIGTNNGLSKFNVENNKFINYTELDGICGNHFNRGAAVKLDCGQILFGTSKGVVSFNPADISEVTNENDKVVIGKITVNGELIDFNTDSIKLKYNENNILFQYFIPYYGKIGTVTYIYKLEGVDKAWRYVNETSFANYTLLEPGEYTFKVKAMNNSGNITDETAIKFTIKSPLWKTRIAYCFYIFSAVGIFIFILNRVAILRAIVKKQTKEINAQMEENKRLYERNIRNEKFKNDYFVNLSHELRTPINIILSALQLMSLLDESGKNSKEKSKHYMGVIKNSSKNLLKIINDIIDSSKIESGVYKINKQKDIDIVYLVEETALNMSSYINEKGIELVIDPEVEEKTICCDPNEIERCIINILGNAVKFTDEGGKITVLIEDDNDNVKISIEDTGIGISKDDQEFIFKRFEQGKNFNSTKVSSSGIGLTLVKYVVELHGGSVALESELNKGSKFIITLPVE